MSQDTPVTALTYTRCPVPTPLGLAARQGWFNEEFRGDGIEIHTLQETTDPNLRESHYDHHLSNSFRQGGNVPALWARARGADTRVIGLNWIDESQVVLSRPDSGILAPHDLKGRRIGLPLHDISIDHGRASALRGVLVTLEQGGLSRKDVELVDIAIPRAPVSAGWGGGGRGGGGYTRLDQALQSGEVDAIFVKGARGLQAAHERGAHIVYDIRHHPDPKVRANNGAPRPITVDAALLRNRRDLVVRFLTRIVKVADWAAEHKSETVAYIAKESGSTDEWVLKAYGADAHLHQGTDLDPVAIAALDGYKNFLFENGFLAANFDIGAWIDPAPLAEVRRLLERKAA